MAGIRNQELKVSKISVKYEKDCFVLSQLRPDASHSGSQRDVSFLDRFQ
jgi:hypothetical protein